MPELAANRRRRDDHDGEVIDVAKHHIVNLALVVVLAGVGVGAYASVGTDAASSTTKETVAVAKKGIVLSSVTASGTAQASKNLGVSFLQTGTLASLNVNEGQIVTAGQVLASLDGTTQRAALASAKASVAAAQASLDAKYRGQTSTERAQDAASLASASAQVSSAQTNLTHARETSASNSVRYQQQVDQAQASLTSARSSTASAKVSLSASNATLRSLQSSYDVSASSGEDVNVRLNRYRSDQVDCANHAGSPGYHTSDGADCAQIANLVTFASNVQQASSSLTQAQSSETSAQNAVTSALQSQSSGRLQDQQSIENSQNSLESAQASYRSTSASTAVKQAAAKPEEIAQAKSSLAAAEQQLATAELNYQQTILRAPTAGVVSSLSSVVGQYVGGGGGSSSSSSTSSSSFVQLTDLNSVQIKVGFTETDAPKVHVGGATTMTLDALSGKTFTGKVLSIDTNQTSVNNVVTYYAIVGFDTAATGVKPGMTSSVSVVLDKVEEAVTLPTSAVSSTGTTASVSVRQPNGKDVVRSITIGLRGDSAVQITNGLAVGDKVVVKSAASSLAGVGGFPGGGGPPGGGLGGGLGGGR